MVTQKFIIRKLKPKDSCKRVYHLVAHPANPDAATKPLDYSGMGSVGFAFLDGSPANSCSVCDSQPLGLHPSLPACQVLGTPS